GQIALHRHPRSGRPDQSLHPVPPRRERCGRGRDRGGHQPGGRRGRTDPGPLHRFRRAAGFAPAARIDGQDQGNSRPHLHM
ncbi:MAG: hypothetical protein AVDCRST_MAG70-2125, partial [uncultured Thermomicrobiales bacterium]